jgi:hypothetical protein
MDSRREKTNLTSKFKMQGPNASKRIMATIGPRKGRNPGGVPSPRGKPGFYLFPYLSRNLSFKRLLPEPLSLLENVNCTFLYNA